MGNGIKQTELLAELHSTGGSDDLAEQVRRLLQQAEELQEQARQCRIQAGQLLYEMKAARPGNWRGQCGVSAVTENALIRMANGTKA